MAPTADPTTATPVSTPTMVSPTYAPSSELELTVADGTENEMPEPSGGPPVVAKPTLTTPNFENAQPASLNPTSNGEMARCTVSLAMILETMVAFL